MEELVENLTIESENSPKSRPQTRSLSPSRSLSSTFDFENNPDPLYRQAMKKISDGCSRFSKERDGMLLTAFEGTAMDKYVFKDMLRRGLNIRLSIEEVEAVMPTFDRNHNGVCDGEEFILMFYRLRYEHSKKLLTQRIAAEKKILQHAKERIQKRQEEFEQKNTIDIDYDYTDEIKKSALDKLTIAAFRYDRLMPGTVQLNAFDGSIMTPKIFKEQLKHVFNIKLTPKELGALMNYFDRTGSGVINCAEFLVTFYRIGFEERSKYLRKEREKRAKIEEEKKRKIIEEKEELETKNKLKVNYHYTEDDKERAFRKLRNAARLYDKNTPGAPSMKGFEGAFLEPHVFKEQLKRVFNLKLTPPELGALMHAFDDDGDGTINCAEFTKNFLKLGFSEREAELKEMHEKQKLNEEKRRQEELKRLEEQERRNAMKVTYDYTEEDFNSAIKKLTDAAWKYDKNMPGAVGLDAFEGLEMEPHVFKEQLKRVLNINLTPPELGALMSYFDKNRDGHISCAEFLIQFTKVGFEERSRRRQYWKAYEERKAQQKKKEDIKKQILAEQRNALKVTYDFREEDFHSAISKLTDAATRYDRSTAGAVGLDAFEGEAMLPHVFKEQLKRVFNIHLTPPELGALMSYFDKNRDGTINCAEFLIQFFRTGFEERSRVRAHWRELKKQRIERELKYEEERKKENEQRAMASVDYNFTEADFDSALVKFINMCHRFDRRQLGPAGLIAFQADTVTPSQFREMIKRSFDMLVTPTELGALVTYWDPELKGRVSCQSFLNSFTQGRVKCEAFKNKPGELQKLQEYHSELKENYKLRIQKHIQKTDDNSLKPWRVNSVTTFTNKPAPKKPYPTTAEQKVRRRIAVAKKTGRLDLSTQSIQPDNNDNNNNNNNENNNFNSQNNNQINQNLIQEVEETNNEGNENPETNNENDNNNENNDNNLTFTNIDKNNEGNSSPVSSKREFVNQWLEPIMPKASEIRKLPSTNKKSTIEYYLTELPNEALSINGLHELWLDNNPLQIFPSFLHYTNTLQTLSLSNTLLTEIPNEINLLTSLKNLYLQNNKITEVKNVNNLVNLVKLNLSNNLITGSFPGTLFSLTNLSHLDISYNKINTLPEQIIDLIHLLILNILETDIHEISENIPRRMTKLVILGKPIPKTEKKRLIVDNFGMNKNEEIELMQFLKNRAKNRKNNTNEGLNNTKTKK